MSYFRPFKSKKLIFEIESPEDWCRKYAESYGMELTYQHPHINISFQQNYIDLEVHGFVHWWKVIETIDRWVDGLTTPYS
jgi:hypothetical protein